MNENLLIWAIVCSFLLHALLAVVIPQLKFESSKKTPDVLKVDLVQPKKPVPVGVIQPKIEPTEPEKPKHVEPIKPKTIPKSEQALDKPTPATENKPEVAKSEPPPPPAMIAVTPKADVAPAITVPTAEPIKEKSVNDDAYNAAKGSYKSSVQKEIQRNLRYPKMAEKHRITGIAKVEIHLDKDGNVISVVVISHSGNDSLDAEAIAVIKRSDLKQFMNDTLVDRINPLIIPISFTLPDE